MSGFRSGLAACALIGACATGVTTRGAEPLPGRLDLYVGDSEVLPVAADRIAVGNGRIVSVSTLERGQLLVQGEAAGSTVLQLWLRSGARHRLTVHVAEASPEHRLEQVRNLLQGTERVRARVAGNRIVLEGEQVSDVEQERASAIAQAFPGIVLNFVEPLGWEQMIQMDVRIVELRGNSARDLGIRWDSSINGPNAAIIADLETDAVFPAPPLDDPSLPARPPGNERIWPPATYLGWTSAITSRIDLLAQKGDAHIIAEPMLSCRSGGSARFVSGGEVPIPTIDRLGATDVEFKEYGIILDVKPRADRTGVIYAEIDTEVSQVDEAVRVLGVPGFLKRRSTTAVNLRAGETAIIAGLVNRSGSRDTRAVPGLGSVPGVGGLFRSTQRRQARSELVILITPRLMRGEPSAPPDSTESNARRLEQVERDVQAVEAAGAVQPSPGGGR